jgi:hypothetical protein
VDKAPHNTGASLMTKVTKVMKFLIKDFTAKACRRSRKRIEAKMEANGGFF